jgi:hypothetical protein
MPRKSVLTWFELKFFDWEIRVDRRRFMLCCFGLFTTEAARAVNALRRVPLFRLLPY